MRFLGEIARLNAKRFGDKTALIFEDDRLSFAELNACADGIGRQLLDLGIRAGDRVALLAENCLEFFPLYFGIVKIGAVMVPLNFRCAVAELEHMIRDCSPSALFHTDAFASQAEQLKARCPDSFKLVRMSRDLLDVDARPLARLPDDFDEQATAAIMYTSGTTGLPKGAMLPHRSLIEGAASTALAAGIRSSDRVVVTVPLFHGGGMYVVSHPHLYVGASIVLTAKFDPVGFLGLIETHEATTFFGVPTQYAVLLDSTSSAGLPATFKTAWYGGAPMPIEIVKRSQILWPEVRFLQCYGQTETTLNTVLSVEDHDRKLGSAGQELPHTDIRVVDEHGVDCPVGVVGEVIVAREAGMTGYFNNPDQTAETIRDGWIYSGDLGFFDEERFLTLVDRKKDMFVSGGENVYPKEIEEVLYACQGVVEVAVVGGPHPKWGEVPVGFVVIAAESKHTASSLQAWCEDRLARYKVPRQWHLVDELPKNASGKVRKNILREQLKTGGASNGA